MFPRLLPTLHAGGRPDFVVDCILVRTGNDCLQIEDAFYQLPNPYPEEEIVGVVKQTLAIVDESGRQVPLSEVIQHTLDQVPYSHVAKPCNHHLLHEDADSVACVYVLPLEIMVSAVHLMRLCSQVPSDKPLIHLRLLSADTRLGLQPMARSSLRCSH